MTASAATVPYPKRLIEVDLPIRRISAHARREKSIRHGHISTLHIWWARRPLAACRAVICAALWPDPADPHCPQTFRDAARERMHDWADLATHTPTLRPSPESFRRFSDLVKLPARLEDDAELRAVLLDFIADFANWDNSTNAHYLETARALTQAAHEALGGEPGTRPLVVDPFAGGGAIPLEALRVGADAFASDLNPVAVLLNKVVLEYIPKYGQRLADEVRKWGQWIKEQAERELAEFYPKDPDGATPIAYLWARTIRCEGPGCGAEVPLIRSLWLAKRGPRNSVALRLIPNAAEKHVDFEIIRNATPKDVAEGTVRKGSATCPVCGYTTPVASVRRQLSQRRGGAFDAQLIAVRRDDPASGDRGFRRANGEDHTAALAAKERVLSELAGSSRSNEYYPSESLPPKGTLGFRVQSYGIARWRDLFGARQLLALGVFSQCVRAVAPGVESEVGRDLAIAVQTSLAVAVDRLADFNSSLCVLNVVGGRGVVHTFGRQALPIVWDFMETNPFNDVGANWQAAVDALVDTMSLESWNQRRGTASQASATSSPLPSSIAQCLCTDPPYYDAVPYADLSDFFYVWLRRTLGSAQMDLFSPELTGKDDECIMDDSKGKDKAFFERTMTAALTEGKRILTDTGIGVVVFAHKSTAGWEAQLQAMIDSGWAISGSWPIDTERPGRLRAHDSAALASSIHLVCRPRDPSPAYAVGDWRDVLDELPRRTHAWLPRLVEEGIVGADAIFACLGPAVEIFSRYQRVEKANGDPVTLRDYLPHVWAAVSREALRAILDGDDDSGFEEDARLTAIWFWVLKASADTTNSEARDDGEGDELYVDDNEGSPLAVSVASKGGKTTGYAMEYDAARKLAQGLGVDLARLSRPGGIVTIRGNIAALHAVTSRENHLLGVQLSLFDDTVEFKTTGRRLATRTPSAEMNSLRRGNYRPAYLFGELPSVPSPSDQPTLPLFAPGLVQRSLIDTLLDSGHTTLDRLHQAMLLFGRGQSSLVLGLLTETQMANNPRFWRLAQALSALYPLGSDEKRWVDGVLARKKGWGL